MAATPLLVGAPPPVASKDRHVRALLADKYHGYQQWKDPSHENTRAALTRLRDTLDRLLPVLTGARDFAGAAKVLSIMYHRFTVAPALCVQTSLEILRRQPEHRDDLLQFYLAAIQENRLDKRLLLKELWMFYIIQGEFYEAYHLYKDDIQRLDVHEDPRLLANFGILCYWLLFIESSELREKLKRDEDLEDDDDDDDEEIDLDLRDEGADDDEEEEEKESSEPEGFDDDGKPAIRSKKRKRASRINQWPSSSQSSTARQSVESIIESRYLFKTSIGVHILYQEATSALRRAASLCPTSAQFAEFYVQLLVLVGEIDTACDYLENFYHLNDSDPHGAKMLASFLEMYYPDSIDTQITVYLRWLKNDPVSSYALEKIVELVSAGSIPTMDLIQALIQALDVCGGDLYLSQAPSAALALWKLLAEFLVAIRYEMADQKDALKQKLIEIGTKRVWWKRAYFARPRSKDEVLAIVQSSKDNVMVEAMIYRANVAMNLFGYGFPTARAVHATFNVANPDKSIKPEHVRVFKSCFANVDHLRFKFVPPMEAPRVLFRDLPFQHIVHQQEPNTDLLAEFKGEYQLAATHAIKRSDLIMNANAAQERRVQVVTESLTHEVDEQLVAALEDALRDDSLAQEIEEEHYRVMAQRSTRMVLPATAVALATVPDGSRKPRKHEMALPLYVNLVEETAFKDRHAPINHIYTFVVESLKQMPLKGVIIPTLMEVENAHRLFLIRWMRNEFKYGHPGLLLRYEMLLAKFVQPHVHAALRAGGHFAVTSAMVDDAIQQMRVQIAASHVHFPERHEVEVMLRVKARVMLRLRRKVLRYFRHSMKVVMVKLVFLDERELASLAYEVCKANGLEGVVSLEDLECIAVPALFRIYRKLLFKMRVPHRMFVRDVIYQAREQNQQQPVDVEFLTAKLKEKFPKYSPSVRTLKACLWVTTYESVYGPLENFWNWMERMPRSEWHEMKLRERELLREYNQEQQAETMSAATAAVQDLEVNELRI
ncbi:hypothetical protein Gpo141_00012749 [Globisporangium polare]